MIVLVTGGRNYRNRDFVWSTLDKAHARRPITKLVEGGATGADEHARSWARERGIDPTTCDADWHRYRGHAGREHRPHVVVAFKGGTGTRHMVRIAKEAGVPVLETWRHEPK